MTIQIKVAEQYFEVMLFMVILSLSAAISNESLQALFLRFNLNILLYKSKILRGLTNPLLIQSKAPVSQLVNADDT